MMPRMLPARSLLVQFQCLALNQCALSNRILSRPPFTTTESGTLSPRLTTKTLLYHDLASFFFQLHFSIGLGTVYLFYLLLLHTRTSGFHSVLPPDMSAQLLYALGGSHTGAGLLQRRCHGAHQACDSLLGPARRSSFIRLPSFFEHPSLYLPSFKDPAVLIGQINLIL